jgi:flagellar hook-length control protein FliK
MQPSQTLLSGHLPPQSSHLFRKVALSIDDNTTSKQVPRAEPGNQSTPAMSAVVGNKIQTQRSPAPFVAPQAGTAKEKTREAFTVPSEISLPLRSDSIASTRATAHTGPARADLPAYITRQIADVIQYLPNKPVEISLNPEELGRLRLAMSATESGLVVNVAAERPETLDLLRRQITLLDQELQALGYEDVSFSFDSNPRSGTQADQEDVEPASGFEPQQHGSTVTQNDAPNITHPAQSGLDLRL